MFRILAFSLLVSTFIAINASAGATLSFFAEDTRPPSQLINEATASCYSQMFTQDHAQDVPARHLKVSAPPLVWRATDADLHITKIHIEIGGFPKGNPQSFDIAGEELRALFSRNNNLLEDSVVPRAGSDETPSEKTLACPLIIGGIQLTPAQDIFFVGSGFVSLQGFTRNDAGEENEIETAFEFDLQNGQAPE